MKEVREVINGDGKIKSKGVVIFISFDTNFLIRKLNCLGRVSALLKRKLLWPQVLTFV